MDGWVGERRSQAFRGSRTTALVFLLLPGYRRRSPLWLYDNWLCCVLGFSLPCMYIDPPVHLFRLYVGTAPEFKIRIKYCQTKVISGLF